MARKTQEKQAEQQAASAVVAAPAQAPDVPANAVATIRGLLEARSDELEAGLRTFGISPERFKSVALAQFSRRPELWACEPLSVYRAMKEAADYGLEPTGAIGGAHLVPYGNQATLLIDYRGLVRMVRRSGEIARVEARVVREQDQFRFAYGLDPYLEHVPALVPDPGELKYVYAVAIFRDGERQFDVMSKAEVELIRQRSRAGRSGPWVTDYFEMAKKTVLRRLCKLMPLDDTTRTALAREDEREGEQRQMEHVGAVVDRQSQLRQQIADRLTPQLGEGPAQQVASTVPPEALQGIGEVVSAEVHTTAEAEQVAAARLAEQAQAEDQPEQPPVAEGQTELPLAGEQLVDNAPTTPAPARQVVDTSPAQRPACGATVSGPQGESYTCTLAPGHRGDHTDGQHDWPATK